MSTSVHLDITSDYICPWCYVGISRIDRLAQELSSEIKLEIHLNPYFLYPDIPKAGSPKKAFANKTKPGMGRALKAEAEHEGISINYKNIERIPNTIEAHRMTSLIYDHGTRWTFAKSLFYAYFETGLDIGNKEIIIKLASKAEVNPDVIESFSNGNHGLDNIKSQVNLAKENFISVVPTLVFDKKLTMSGLQEDSIWKRYIKKAALLQK